jgi:protein phosphatase 1 regulatory subunit 14B
MATYTEYNQASSVESYRNTPGQNISSGRPSSSETHVSFNHKNKEEEKDKRQKYLTAKYGQHQMMLIRKRLAVEDWLFDQLRELYDCQV